MFLIDFPRNGALANGVLRASVSLAMTTVNDIFNGATQTAIYPWRRPEENRVNGGGALSVAAGKRSTDLTTWVWPAHGRGVLR